MKKDFWKRAYKHTIQLVLVGALTGVAVGVVVTLYNLLFAYGTGVARAAYEAIQKNPIWIPVWILALGLTAFLVSAAVQASKIIKGTFIPLTEGETKGPKMLWWRDATLMFATTILEVFMGLSIGSEGASVLMGRAIGDGIGGALKKNFMVRRYQVTGGACAGLAVAANAPLTGIVYAFEEAHKRFMPEVSICAFVSVVFAMLTRSILYGAFGLENTNIFTSFSFSGVELSLSAYPFVLAVGVVGGLTGVLFCKGAYGLRSLFRKITIKNNFLCDFVRIAIAFLLGGTITLIAVETAGSGHHLIQGLGSKGRGVAALFGSPIFVTLLIIALLKGISTCLNVGAGVPCGIFIPMIAIGACIGAALNEAWLALGMDASYCDLMLIICAAVFFATVLKAPITAIVMVCEFTWSFMPLLPVVIGVSIGYVIGDVFRAEDAYEALFEDEDEEEDSDIQVERYEVVVAAGSLADDKEIREILWPTGAFVTAILRGEESVHPEGKTVLKKGDALTILIKTQDRKASEEDLAHIVEA